MTRRSLLIALTGFLAVGFSSASAQPTKSEIKREGKKLLEKGQEEQIMKKAEEKWKDMTPEQKQKAEQQVKQAEERERKRWQALTAEQKQAERDKAKAAGKLLKYKWQQLPE